MRRLVAAALAVACLAAAAFAQEFERGSVRREIQSAAEAGETARALAAIDRILDDATPRIRERHVEAAKAALEFLPRPESSERIARLLAEALRIDPSDRDGAWSLAQSLRRDLIRRADLDTGVRFVEKLLEIYPNVIEYRHDHARLLLDAGRREEARAALEVLFRMAPSDTWAAYTIARQYEEEGDFATAVVWYERLLESRPQELRAHLYRARVLAKRDPAAARKAIDAGLAAAEQSPSETVRADFREAFAGVRADLDADERRRTEIAGMLGHQRDVIAFAAAVWAVLLVVALRLTRATHGGDAPASS